MGHFKVPLPARIDQVSFRKFTILSALAGQSGCKSTFRILAVGLTLCYLQSLAPARPLQQLENGYRSLINVVDGASVPNTEQLNACSPAENVTLSTSGNSAADEPDKDKEIAAPETTIKPVVKPSSHNGSRFALAFKSSTLGLGADLGTRLADRLNLRVGFTGLNYSRTVSDGGFSYVGSCGCALRKL